MDKRVDVNLQDNDGNTALHILAAGGKTSAVKKLLEEAADVSIPNGSNRTPLQIAVKSGNAEAVRLMLMPRGEHTNRKLRALGALSHKSRFHVSPWRDRGVNPYQILAEASVGGHVEIV